MTLLWLCVGLAALAAGNVWMKKGVMSVAVTAHMPTLIYSMMTVLLAGCYGIVFAASAAVQRQSAFLLLMVLMSSVYYAILAGAITSVIRPVAVQLIVWKREGLVIGVCLLSLIFAGRETAGAGHPDIVVGKGYGILFLGIMFAEMFAMLATSMSGYRKVRRERPRSVAFSCLLAALGFVLMVCAGLVTTEQAEYFAGLQNTHPAVCGMAVGIAVGMIRIPELFKELKCGGRRIMSSLWGPASLMLSGGLGISCLIMPVTISYTVEMAAIFALIMLVMYAVCGVLRKRTGRIQAVVLIAVCSEMLMWLIVRLSKGLY